MAGGAARYLLLLLLLLLHLSSCGAGSEHNKTARDRDSRGALITYCSPSCGNHPGLVLGMGGSPCLILILQRPPTQSSVGFSQSSLEDLLGVLVVVWMLLALPGFSPESDPC